MTFTGSQLLGVVIRRGVVGLQILRHEDTLYLALLLRLRKSPLFALLGNDINAFLQSILVE